MPFKSVADIAAAYDNGRWHHQRVFRNTNIYCRGLNAMIDYSMSGGTPKYNAYVGNQLEATAFIGSGNNGIYTGPTPAAGMTKHIAKVAVNTLSTTVPVQHVFLCDYLMFYPLIDGDSTDLQEMIQADTLPRYSDGAGVKMVFVMTAGAGSGGSNITIEYTNSDGVTGRIAQVSIGTLNQSGIVACPSSLWGDQVSALSFPLQGGDRGVRSVQNIAFANGTGVIGALLLFKPLVDIQMLESTTIAEVDLVNQKLSLPRVYDGAYLNFLATGSAAASTTLPLHAGIDFIWG